jgi:hypothetical protein
LGRECRRQKEYFRDVFKLGLRYDILGSEHPVFHERLKHIEIKYYFIQEKVQEVEVKVQYIRTYEKTTDILTKPLSRIKFAYLRDKLGIMEITPLAEREEMALQDGREQ